MLTEIEERGSRKVSYSVYHYSLSSFMSLSGDRETLFSREIEDLKTKLMTKTDELNEATKKNSEVCIPCIVSDYVTIVQLSSQIVDITHKLKDNDYKINELETQ